MIQEIAHLVLLRPIFLHAHSRTGIYRRQTDLYLAHICTNLECTLGNLLGFSRLIILFFLVLLTYSREADGCNCLIKTQRSFIQIQIRMNISLDKIFYWSSTESLQSIVRKSLNIFSSQREPSEKKHYLQSTSSFALKFTGQALEVRNPTKEIIVQRLSDAGIIHKRFHHVQAFVCEENMITSSR